MTAPQSFEMAAARRSDGSGSLQSPPAGGVVDRSGQTAQRANAPGSPPPQAPRAPGPDQAPVADDARGTPQHLPARDGSISSTGPRAPPRGSPGQAFPRPGELEGLPRPIANPSGGPVVALKAPAVSPATQRPIVGTPISTEKLSGTGPVRKAQVAVPKAASGSVVRTYRIDESPPDRRTGKNAQPVKGERLAETPRAVERCSRCNNELPSPRPKRCPSCRLDLEKPIERKCPSCGQMNRGAVRECTRCRTLLI
ncbi:MAG: hypothetical protein HYV07_17345 [Deltaproteobacteria bacterium]|nr:hypothetical protein [Deltaproteobacteria bacterium]